jgi:rhodanese-related sulfurtransferase
MLASISEAPSEFRSLNGFEFRNEYNKSKCPVLLDVRTPGEFLSGTIEGATNIDVMSSDFGEQLRKLDKSKEYFLFCRSGGRSAHACSIMAGLGFHVSNLQGGIGAWPR